MLASVALACFRRRRPVVASWIVALAVAGGLALGVGGRLSNDFEVPGAESQQAFDLLVERFPERSGDAADVVFRADDGVDDPVVRQRMERLLDDVGRLEHVTDVASPYDPGSLQRSPDGKIAFARVQLDVRGTALPTSVVGELQDLTERATTDRLQVEAGGQAISFAEREPPGRSEQVGLVAAAAVLLLTFGSVVAAGLPLLTALGALGVALAALGLLANVVDVAVFGPQLATMIGLGVGIDYALLIVTRYREGLAAGLEPERATVLAITTAGRSVLFAGATVVISLLGLFLMGFPLVRGVAVGAVVAVLLTVLATLTLLPALLGFAGPGIDRLRITPRRRVERHGRTSAWFRWSRVVQRHPWAAFGAGAAILIVLALPVLSLRLGSTDAGSGPTSRSSRRAYDLLTDGFGPGVNGPLLLVAPVEGPDQRAAVERLPDALGSAEGVLFVAPPQFNPAGDAAIVALVPESAPQDEATSVLIDRLRDEVLPTATAGTGLDVHVGGVTAAFDDLSTILARRLPVFIGVVLALSFLLLLVVFRSVVVPLKAVIMNLLSIGAAYGVIVAVFQWGWLAGVLGVDRPGPIMSFVPMMLFAILFGLSMDYEVFLISRVREEYLRTGDNGLAVADGLATTGRVITAAAAIMVTVFASFVLSEEPLAKLFGLGLAVAILLDATVVRTVLVPATMALLGNANWWLPAWLDRRLPHFSVDSGDVAARPDVAARSNGHGRRRRVLTGIGEDR